MKLAAMVGLLYPASAQKVYPAVHPITIDEI